MSSLMEEKLYVHFENYEEKAHDKFCIKAHKVMAIP